MKADLRSDAKRTTLRAGQKYALEEDTIAVHSVLFVYTQSTKCLYGSVES